MKKYLFIIAILNIVAIELSAQTYGKTYTPASRDYEASIQSQQVIQSHQIMSSGANYGGTVYKPFDNTTPSEQSEVGASYSPNKAPGGPRRDKVLGPDTPPADESPVGEPWILLAFAAVFAAGIAFRRKKQTV